MPSLNQIFPFIPLVVFAIFGWRYFRSGSLVGALLGGRLTETIGEISLSSQGISSRVLRVSLMAAPLGQSPELALAITSKAAFGASVVPFKLTHPQALELISLLQRGTQMPNHRWSEREKAQ
jgi:hypothetical protein